MVKQLPINPKTLKWARESANISVEEVAFRMKKAAETVEGWEQEGAHSITYVQLEKLAYEIYKRPIAIFFFPDPPTEVDPRSSFRTIPSSELDDLPSTFFKLHLRNIEYCLKCQLLFMCWYDSMLFHPVYGIISHYEEISFLTKMLFLLGKVTLHHIPNRFSDLGVS